MQGLKLTNEVVNSDLANGVNGWSLYSAGAILAVEGDYVSFLANVPTQAITQKNKVYNDNDVFYFSAVMKVELTPVKLNTGFAASGVGVSLIPGVDVGLEDTLITGMLTAQSNLTSFVWGRSSVVQKIYLKKGATVFNLTKIFGAGNEPTKAEMDTLIKTLGINHFSGEMTLTARQLALWQLKMIRQNRNAIIALGGTVV